MPGVPGRQGGVMAIALTQPKLAQTRPAFAISAAKTLLGCRFEPGGVSALFRLVASLCSRPRVIVNAEKCYRHFESRKTPTREWGFHTIFRYIPLRKPLLDAVVLSQKQFLRGKASKPDGFVLPVEK
jgi:hypothetical protein